ncbi:ABC transporter ATP-binding protein [Geochorda subterranea]|uniref:ABC transporter ATP-binding protein n=1 Tax=Geochorda subterranea TaxID=3109564 RepID=A0ABZ1BMW2_9FIRM|nr:ABC transporter ATP-binding protein [Limnochorda sp. LNt]WRP13893.1 ABC transporter ATP-binding protein [Limnochorda sp. LNt]
MVLRTEGLTRRFGSVVAVDHLDLHVAEGEIYGFLGPNGAGKTTTIMMVLGLVPPTEGRIWLFGQPLGAGRSPALRRRIGVLSEFHYLYEEMTAQEYLEFFARLYGVSGARRRIDELLERLELADRRRELLGGYSKGMKQKLSLARTLLHDPELLILDEPVSSLDPYGIRQVRDLLLEENRRGKTLVISSHILSEVERICHRVGIIHRGRLLAEDTMDGLRTRLATEQELEVELERVDEPIVAAVQAVEGVSGVDRRDGKLLIRTRTGVDLRPAISRAIAGSGGVVLSMQTRQMSLEEAFVTITENNISLLAREGMAS